MRDSFNRKIDYLRISVTDRCNLRCIYCMPEGGVSLLNHDDILRYEEISAIVKASVELGIDKFRITGGEPLVRKGFVEFIGRLNDIDGIRDLSITTNGMKLKEYARPLYEVGVKRINISLDTLNENRFKEIARQGELKDVINGIDEAFKVGFFPIKINIVLVRGLNDDEILDFVRLTYDKPLLVRFIELMPIGVSQFLGEDKLVPIEEVKKICSSLGLLKEEAAVNGNGPATYYKLDGWAGKIGFIGAMTDSFCERCNRLRLTADGFLKPCLGYEDGVDLKPALRPIIDCNEIKNLIKEAIDLKPKGHNMTEKGTGYFFINKSSLKKVACPLFCSMSKIGG